jgi:hypothetical protein
MRGPSYTKEFFAQEVERLTLLLTQSLSAEDRVSYQSQLAAARKQLAEFGGK